VTSFVQPAAVGQPLGTAMAPSRRRVVGVVNVVEGVLALIALMAAYGLAEHLVGVQEAAGADAIATWTVHWWGPDFQTTLSMSLMLVGAAAGVVGSVIQQSIVFAQRAGHETLERGFVWWYVLRPVWSGLLGAVVVVAANASLISIGDETTSAPGVTTLVMLGCLAGLFTDQALQRLAPMLGATPPEKSAIS
jgi:hypothetical protein